MGSLLSTIVKAAAATHAIDTAAETVRAVAEITTASKRNAAAPTGRVQTSIAGERIGEGRMTETEETVETVTNSIPSPAQGYFISGTCVACGAPIAGYAGQPVRCEYCDTLQAIQSKYFNVPAAPVQPTVTKTVTTKRTTSTQNDIPTVTFCYSSRDGSPINITSGGAAPDFALSNGGRKTLELGSGSYLFTFVFSNKTYTRTIKIHPNTKSVTVSCSHGHKNQIDISSRQECEVVFTYETDDSKVGLTVSCQQPQISVTIPHGRQQTLTLTPGNYAFVFNFNRRTYTRSIEVGNNSKRLTVRCRHDRNNHIDVIPG